MRSTAKIEDGPNSKGQYLLSVGAIRVWASEDQIKESNTTVKIKKKSTKPLSSTTTQINKTLKLDLHGMTVMSALEVLEKTVDRCLIEGYSRIEILHGLGSGKVKQAVGNYLKKSHHVVKHFVDPSNPGVTWALF